MPDVITSNFDLQAPFPIETSMQVQSINDRNSINEFKRWEGMQVYVIDEQTTYRLTGGIQNSQWVAMTAGAPEPGNFIPMSWVDTDVTLGNDSDQRIATQHAVKTYIDNAIGGDGPFIPVSEKDSPDGVSTLDEFAAINLPEGDINYTPTRISMRYADVYNEGGMSAFLELGQSNMQGRDGDESNPNYPFDSADGNISWNGSSAVTLNTLRGGAQGGSHANYFGDRFYQNTGLNCYMIESASGGAGLASNSGASSGNHWGPDGNLRGEAETKASNALSNQGITRLTGILWCQGERDAQQMDDVPSYTYEDCLSNMRDVIEWMQSTWPGVPIYISETGDTDPPGNTQGWQNMRDIQYQVTQEYDGVFLAFRNAKNFPSEGKMTDSLHYNYDGYKEMGEAFADYVSNNQRGVYYWDGIWRKIGQTQDIDWNEISGKPNSLSGYGITDAVSTVADIQNPISSFYEEGIDDITSNSRVYVSESNPDIPSWASRGGFIDTYYTSLGQTARFQFFWERMNSSFTSGGSLNSRFSPGGSQWSEWVRLVTSDMLEDSIDILRDSIYPVDASIVINHTNYTTPVGDIEGSGAFFHTIQAGDNPGTGQAGTGIWALSTSSGVIGKLALEFGTEQDGNDDSFHWQSRTGEHWYWGASREWTGGNFVASNQDIATQSENQIVDVETVMNTSIFTVNRESLGSTNMPPINPNHGIGLISITGGAQLAAGHLALEFSDSGIGGVYVQNFRENPTPIWQGWREIPTVLVGEESITWSTVAPGSTQARTVTVEGAEVGDLASVILDPSDEFSLIYQSYVSASDEVTIVATNFSGSGLDPTDRTFRVIVQKLTQIV